MKTLKRMECCWWSAMLLCWALTGGTHVLGGDTHVLEKGRELEDVRLQSLKDLDGYFPFQVPENREAWSERSAWVRRQLLVTLGLWPMPSPTPLNAVVHGKIELDDYTVERVFFESAPGFYVTGNLYRPRGKAGKLPVVLCPHGHWDNGRFVDNPRIRQEIAAGGERFEVSGRSVLQSRCVQLARMGCVVFHYDMIGYADSVQISQALAHGFAKQRENMNEKEGWGLFSAQAELRYQSVMGLQTLNSIRALDFVLGLPDVDPDRVGVTGASGGGTQTFILCALDSRPTVAFPAVMVGTAMQGGCTCENASGLRVGTGNVEMAALFAPKPLGMTGADDWTKEMATKGYPELKQLYGLYGRADMVMFKPLNHFGHNYNAPSRCVMYGWMNRHLKLGLPEPVIENDFRLLTRDEMTVWNQAHPAPKGGEDFERSLLRWWDDDARVQLEKAQEKKADFRKVYGQAWEAVVGRALSKAGEVSFEQSYKDQREGYGVYAGLLKDAGRGESSPVVFYLPESWNGQVVLWIHAEGKAGLCDASAGGRFAPSAAVRELVSRGAAVAGLDLLYQGESRSGTGVMDQAPKVKNPREAAAYTLGYNASVFAQRVHDVLRLASFVRHHERQPKGIALVGLAGAGPWVACAAAVAGAGVDYVVADLAGFEFRNVKSIRSLDLLPGALKYGDVEGALAVGSPRKLVVAGLPGQGGRLLRRAYELEGASAPVQLESGVRVQAGEVVDRLKGMWP